MFNRVNFRLNITFKQIKLLHSASVKQVCAEFETRDKTKNVKNILVRSSILSRFVRADTHNALGCVKRRLIDAVMLDTVAYDPFAFATKVLNALTTLNVN